PWASKKTTFPCRATRVMAPATCPSLMSRRTASLALSSLADDIPTASGLAVGSSPAVSGPAKTRQTLETRSAYPLMFTSATSAGGPKVGSGLGADLPALGGIGKTDLFQRDDSGESSSTANDRLYSGRGQVQRFFPPPHSRVMAYAAVRRAAL